MNMNNQNNVNKVNISNINIYPRTRYFINIKDILEYIMEYLLQKKNKTNNY